MGGGGGINSARSFVINGFSSTRGLSSNAFGFGLNYLKVVNKNQKISKALKVDPKV